MAFINQEKKKELAPGIKAVLKKYGVKGTISIDNFSVLNVNIKEGPFDFAWSFKSIDGRKGSAAVDGNVSFMMSDGRNFEGVEKEFLDELSEAMNVGNHDNSDMMTDYFDVGWYSYINIGKWNKSYKVV